MTSCSEESTFIVARSSGPAERVPVPLRVLRYLSASLWLIVFAVAVGARPREAVTNGNFGAILLLYGTGMALAPWFIGPLVRDTAPTERAGSSAQPATGGSGNGALAPLCVLWSAVVLAYLPFWLNEATALARMSPPSESMRASTGTLALFLFLFCGPTLSLVSCFTLKRGWLYLLVHLVPAGLVVVSTT